MQKFYPVISANLPNDVMAETTGEFRTPKKGEWFLSGAVVEAYQARANLKLEYRIARLIRVETVTTIVKVGEL